MHLPGLITITVYLGLIFPLHAQNWEGGWSLAKEKDGIKVFTRKSEGSSLKDSKAIVTVAAPIEEVYAIIADFDDHYRWIDRLKTSKVLKKLSETEYIVYYEAGAPWPVSNRDVVSKYKIIKKPSGEMLLDSEGMPDYIPKNESIVRVKRSKGRWHLIPLDNTTTKIIFYNHSDPSGMIPDWLANSTAKDTPYNTFQNLRQRLGL